MTVESQIGNGKDVKLCDTLTDIPRIKQAFKHDGLIVFFMKACNMIPLRPYPHYDGYLEVA